MKPTVVMLHGFLGEGSDFAPLAATYHARAHILTPDLPGHGSAKPLDGELTIEAVVLHLEDELRRVGRPVHLVGYSMGGRLAMRIAARKRVRVESLALLATSPGLRGASVRRARRERDASWARQFNYEPIRQVLRAWYDQPIFGFGPEREAALDALIARRAQNRPFEMARYVEAMSPGTVPHQWERLKRLTVPVALCYGRRDRTYRRIMLKMHALQPSSQVLAISGAAHAIHIERPRVLGRHLRAFQGI